MLQTQTLAIQGHLLILVPGDAVHTGLELKSSVPEAVVKQLFHFMCLSSVLSFLII